MTPRIFVCYRRNDTAGHAGRLYDWLLRDAGVGDVYMDVADIPPGTGYPGIIREQVSRSTAMVAIVGPRWLTSSPIDGAMVPSYVEVELNLAKEIGLQVVPVLVWDTAMPEPAALPGSLRWFASRNALSVRDDGWKAGVERLVAALNGPTDGPLPKERLRARRAAARRLIAGWADHNLLGDLVAGRLGRRLRSTEARAEAIVEQFSLTPENAVDLALRKPELRNACADLGIPVSGDKSTLIGQLLSRLTSST
jgi:hypothetical protein